MSNVLKSTFFLLSAFIFSLSFLSNASAQGVPGVGTVLSLTMSPENPRPGESVNLTTQSYSIDMDSSVITWTVDGKTIQSGRGLRQAEVVAGEIGTIKKITVSVATGDGPMIQTAEIRPADLAILWEASSYVPAFYKGKALFAYGGGYKATAFAHVTDRSGKKIDPKTLVYRWSKNDAVEETGYGKTSFVSSQAGFVRGSDDISVTVTIPGDEKFSFTETISVEPVDPEIIFYENNPLYGIWLEGALPLQLNLDREEFAVEAEPYYFSTGMKSIGLDYIWSLNGESVFNFDNKSTLILRKVDDVAGVSEIGINVENPSHILQGATSNLIIRHE